MQYRDRKPRRYRDGFRDAVLCGCAALLIFLVFTTGVLNRQKVWTDVQLDYAGNKKAWSIENGDVYGRVASGPYYSLPAGKYRVQWQIEGDGQNRMVFSCSNDARMSPKEVTIDPESWMGEAWIDIAEPTHSFAIHLDFVSGTWMQVYNIRLYSPFYTDRAYAFSAVLIVLCVLLLMYWHGKLTGQDLREWAVVGAAVLFASMLYLCEDVPKGCDTRFHTARLQNLADGIAAGQFPVRCGGFSYNGYGALTSVFYPDLLLYPFALMLLGGASMSYTLSTLIVSVNVATAYVMLLAGRRLLGSREAARCASILYLLSIYRLVDIYDRIALGELLAMAFLPLFLLGLYEVVLGEKRRWPVLVLGATLVFRSHMLSTVLCALAAMVVCCVFMRRILREHRLSVLLLSCFAALLLNINQILPMVMCYIDGVNTTVVQFGFANSAQNLLQLLQTDCNIGLALIFGIVAFVCVDVPQPERTSRHVLWLLLLAGAACTILASKLVPWSHIVRLTHGMVEILQFPWRFLLLAAACFALCGGDGFARLLSGRGMRACVITLVIAVTCAMPYLNRVSETAERFEFGFGAKVFMEFPEYQIAGTSVEDTRSRQMILAGDVQVSDYEKKSVRIACQVEAKEDASVMFPIFGFPGYVAEINGERIAWHLGDNNRLTVDIPAGTSGEISIRYAGKALWRIADAVSLLTAVGLAAWCIRRKRGYKRSEG